MVALVSLALCVGVVAAAPTSLRFPLKKVPAAEGDGDSINLPNFRNAQWYAEMVIGTPPQKINVCFDTGSTLLWVASSDVADEYHTHNTFNTSASETYKLNGTVQPLAYGTGYLDGLIGYDSVSIGGFGTSAFKFMTVSNFSGFPMKFYRPDGVLGMGFPAKAYDYWPTIMSSFVAEGTLEQNVFSLNLNQDADGELLIGGIDTDAYVGDLTYMQCLSNDDPIVDYNGLWFVAMDGMRVEDAFISTAGNYTIIDSATNYVVGPASLVAALAAAVGAVTDACDDDGNCPSYKLPCNTAGPDIKLSIDGNTWSLSKQNYIIYKPTNPHGMCDFAFIAVPGYDTVWMLGDFFIRQYYTVWDYENKRIGYGAKAIV